MKKSFIISIGALAAVAALAAYFLLSNLDSLVESAVEKYGSEATGTKVSLKSAKIKIADGAGTLEGLTVGNPAGFIVKQALVLEGVDISIDPASVRGNGPVIIKRVVMSKPKITYEVLSSGSTNLDVIKRHATAEVKDSEETKTTARKYIIEDLYIQGGAIVISHPLLQGKTLSENLPTIHLRDIGKSKGGATPGEIAAKVASAIESSATKVSAPDLNRQLDQLKGIANTGAGKVTDKVKGLFGR